MSKRYFIHKSCRLAYGPYNGPTIQAAGIVSRWYDNFDEAQVDADKLTACNRVGFVVCEEGKQ